MLMKKLILIVIIVFIKFSGKTIFNKWINRTFYSYFDQSISKIVHSGYARIFFHINWVCSSWKSSTFGVRHNHCMGWVSESLKIGTPGNIHYSRRNIYIFSSSREFRILAVRDKKKEKKHVRQRSSTFVCSTTHTEPLFNKFLVVCMQRIELFTTHNILPHSSEVWKPIFTKDARPFIKKGNPLFCWNWLLWK